MISQKRAGPLWTVIDVGTLRKRDYIPVMFAEFLKRLTATETEDLPDEDARLALTALLVRIARSDNDYSDDERQRIDRISARRYGLGPGAVSALREEAETKTTPHQKTNECQQMTTQVRLASPKNTKLAGGHLPKTQSEPGNLIPAGFGCAGWGTPPQNTK